MIVFAVISILFNEMRYLTSSKLPERHAKCNIVALKILNFFKFHKKKFFLFEMK